MIDYREIIRLKSLRFSNVAIANSLCCSRNTVSEVLKLAETHSLGWPIPDTLTNNDIEHLFYPGRGTMMEEDSRIMSMSTTNLPNRESPFPFYGQNTVLNAKQNTRSLTSIHNSMKNTMLMLHQRKQPCESNVNREKPWKLTGSAIHLKCMMPPAAVKYQHTFLLLSFRAVYTDMQKLFRI